MHYPTTGNLIHKIDLKKWGYNNSYQLSLLRTDLNYIDLDHPISSFLNGNKLFKLKYNIEYVKESKLKGMLTFGGAYSNHLHAVATAGSIFNFKTIGVVRGEEWQIKGNPTLDFCSSTKMELHFWNRVKYRKKSEIGVVKQLQKEHPDYLIVPEGGSNDLALKGTKEILGANTREYNVICTPIGTGGSISGIYLTKEKQQKLIGFACVAMPFEAAINKVLSNENEVIKDDLIINSDYTFGGFAKHNDTLIEFINRFKSVYNIQLEPIYTGKMLFGIFEMIKQEYFKSNTKIIAIHTGGLQGLAGFHQRNVNLLY